MDRSSGDQPDGSAPEAIEAAAWSRYQALRKRWQSALEPAAERTAAIGTLLAELGAALEPEPDLGWYYTELVRGFVAFSDRLAQTAEAIEALQREAEAEWRAAFDALPETTRAGLTRQLDPDR